MPAAMVSQINPIHGNSSNTGITDSNDRNLNQGVGSITNNGRIDLAGSRNIGIHYDPQIGQSSREVKLWSLVLLFLSGMTLFNNISFFTSTGRFGSSILDGFVTLFDTVR